MFPRTQVRAPAKGKWLMSGTRERISQLAKMVGAMMASAGKKVWSLYPFKKQKDREMQGPEDEAAPAKAEPEETTPSD